MILNLQSEFLYLGEHVKSTSTYLTEEILYLRGHLNDCLHKTILKRDETNFLSFTSNLQKMSRIYINIQPRELNSSEYNVSNNS